VDGIDISVDGGLTLRRTADGYDAEPSHGDADAGGTRFGYSQCASIGANGVKVRDCKDVLLDDWAIRGRADAIKQQLHTILGDRFDRIPAQHWKNWDRFLRGVLSAPWRAATTAYTLRMLLRYNFFADATPDELQAWKAIAGLIAEGTTEADIPLQILEMLQETEKTFNQDPKALAQFKAMARDMIERQSDLYRHQQDDHK
jgi:hypothetical protein